LIVERAADQWGQPASVCSSTQLKRLGYPRPSAAGAALRGRGIRISVNSPACV
jgi:hypothetical protein